MTTQQTMKTATLLTKIHPDLNGLPMIGQEDLAALTESVRQHGIMKPVTLSHDDFVIDGRNRLTAAMKAGLEYVPVMRLAGDVDPLTYAVESAVTGRNLTKSGIVLILYLKHPFLSEGSDVRGFANVAKNPNVSRCDKNHTESRKQANEKGQDNYLILAEKYNVPREYFTRLAHIHGQCDGETWEAVQRSILDRESSIPAMVAGLSGKAKTAGKKRADADYTGLIIKTSATIRNAFANWGKVKLDEKWHGKVMEDFGEAVRHMPPDIKVVTIAAIRDWPQHDRTALIKALK